jgi:hypothetical protein
MLMRQQVSPLAQFVGQLPIMGPPSSTGPSLAIPLSSPVPLLLPLVLPLMLPLLVLPLVLPLPPLLVLPLLPLLPFPLPEELVPQAVAIAIALPKTAMTPNRIDFMDSSHK